MIAPPSASGGFLLALAGAAAYGFNITFARIAAFEGVQGPLMVVFRVIVMLALAIVMALVLRGGLQVAPRDRRALGGARRWRAPAWASATYRRWPSFRSPSRL